MLSFWTTESGHTPSLIRTAALVTVPEAGSLAGGGRVQELNHLRAI